MNQQSRTIIFFVLSGLTLFLWTTFAPKPVAELAPANTATTAAPVQNSANISPIQNPQQNEWAFVETELPQDILVHTPVADITMSNKGGVITSYKLLNYKQSLDANAKEQNLLETQGSLANFTGFEGMPEWNSDRLFTVKESKKTATGHEVILQWNGPRAKIEKIITWGPSASDYSFHTKIVITNTSQTSINGLAPQIKTLLTQREQKTGFLSSLNAQQNNLFFGQYFANNSLNTEQNWPGFSELKNQNHPVLWSALSDRYFLWSHFGIENANTQIIKVQNALEHTLTGPLFALAPQESRQFTYTTYIGPKLTSELSHFDNHLLEAIDYGWFSMLAKPILWLMTKIHGFIPNWGIVILILTLLIKLALHPINNKSMKSMKAMQLLQPKMAELKAKHKNDSQAQNVAIMQLFKTHKVNPMGGCLPMLLQMPIYIVLYKVLWNAIELYHAPFFGFYKDLSAPDPYFILPILLGIFMFLQQKLTPSPTGDDMQKNMMLFMPIMFTAFMLFLPVGLVLYIFVNTITSVLQQYMMKHDLTFVDLFKFKKLKAL